jgi:hypothetical protein
VTVGLTVSLTVNVVASVSPAPPFAGTCIRNRVGIVNDNPAPGALIVNGILPEYSSLLSDKSKV